MAKEGVYGIQSVKLADPVVGGFPSSFTGFDFKAIVKDSVQFNDQAAGTTDVEIEDSDDPYAVLESSAAQKGFTLQIYDLSAEAFAYLMGYTTSGNWNVEPATKNTLEKAVQIVTKTFGEFVSKTFQWARMRIDVTRAGTIGKSGFPNLTATFRQLAHTDAPRTAVLSRFLQRQPSRLLPSRMATDRARSQARRTRSPTKASVQTRNYKRAVWTFTASRTAL